MIDKNKKFPEVFRQKKMEFLDNLQPDDFRNAASFNQAELIIDELYRVMLTKQNPQEFIAKSLSNLFRENSAALAKANELFGQ